MKIKSLADLQNFLLKKYHVKLSLTPSAIADLKAINKGSRSNVLLLILRRVEEGAAFVPDGVARSLHGKLRGYAKIKPKSLNLRIIYRPVRQDDYLSMEVIAIGPRNKDKVYLKATERLTKTKD